MLELFIEALFIFVVVGFFLSGLDDLYIDVRFFLEKLKDLTDFIPYTSEIESKEEQPIAVLIPAWRENEVIEEMVRHNLRQIDYAKYDFFLGVYPNDTPTQERAEILLRRYPHVYAAVLPHDGPTNKADCLNWIYRKMEEVENREKRQYEIIIIHDAEDLIHPKAFKVINAFIPAYDMIQIPIFSLEVPLHKFTAGTYCDEFAEFHLKDIFVRSRIGGFVPSAGVGTGFSRRAFEIIRTRYQGKIFDPHSLTEDYEIGFKFKQSGLSQTFIPCSIKQRRSPQQLRHYPTLLRPLFMEYHDIIATREYFPFRLWDAIRQKTRWIIGIVFQGTKHIGWRGSKEDLYFLLRDRKGAVTHLITFFGNLLFLFGMIVLSLNWLGWGKIDLLQFIPLYSWFWVYATGLLPLHTL
jgi:adsorption protein B